jgi:hypothetical protein
MAGIATPTPIPLSDWEDHRGKPYRIPAYAKLSQDGTSLRLYLYQKRGEHQCWVAYGTREDDWYAGGCGNVIPRNGTPDNDYHQTFKAYVVGTKVYGFWLSQDKSPDLSKLARGVERFIIEILP